MKKASSASNDTKPDVDKAKRVYRAALDAIRRLDDISKQKKAYRDVFLPDAVGLRNKLKEYCERLMFYNPNEYGRKAEEVLWRKVFYDIIQVIKHNRKHVRPHGSLETAYRTHLAAATGYYQHLLFRLQQEFGLKLFGILDFHLSAEPKLSKKHGLNNNKKMTQAVQDWAQRACHRCLICLGDIARYQQDFDRGMSAVTAERYYSQALMLFPDIGMPHNQLGTLSGSRFFSCEAAYHYIRCMCFEKPFEGALGNLKRLFEKNQKRFHELEQNVPRGLPPEQQRPQDIRRFFIRFLHLLGMFYDSNKSIDSNEIQSCCQYVLHDFNLCMFYEPLALDEEELDPLEENLQFLDDDIVFKIVVICIATVYLLQRQGSHQLTASIVFLLALFSHILNHVVIRLQGALYDKENPNKLLQTNTSLVGLPVEDDDDSSAPENERENKLVLDRDQSNGIGSQTKTVGENGDDNETSAVSKAKPARLRHLRRRRRRHHSDGSDVSDACMSDESDLSEGGDDLDDENIFSDESDDDLVNYFDNDSDSDLSDGLMDSQELKPGFATSGDLDSAVVGKGAVEQNMPGSFSQLNSHSILTPNDVSYANGNMWMDNNHLALLSSELFSSSMTFLGQNFDIHIQDAEKYENDVAAYENCKDIIEGKKDVPIPPGFSTSLEAKHVADLTQKLVNFQVETDTEASLGPTDTEYSGVTETDAEDEISSSSTADQLEYEQLRLQRVIDVIQNEDLLPTVKVMCDWMKCHISIITACAQSSQSLWCRLSVLLNFFPLETKLAQHDQCWSDELKTILTESSSYDWNQVFPLREDISVCQLPPLMDIHGLIDFSSQHRGQMSEAQETFLRICCLRQSGHFLTALESLEFTYDEKQAMFLGPTQIDTEKNEKVAQEKMRDAESRRNQLMRDMAQLRLQAEVSQLEGSLQMTEQPVFPPYLIPDTSALCAALALVKQVTQCARSIVVIPLSVIDSLDFMKKESSGAREAIRWLESEFRKGNRYIRAQKSNETVPSNYHRNMKKKNREVWCILEILGCAQYLAKQSGNISSGSVVAVISDQNLDSEFTPPAIKQAVSLCLQQGVALENITEFANQWKESCKNKG